MVRANLLNGLCQQNCSTTLLIPTYPPIVGNYNGFIMIDGASGFDPSHRIPPGRSIMIHSRSCETTYVVQAEAMENGTLERMTVNAKQVVFTPRDHLQEGF